MPSVDWSAAFSTKHGFRTDVHGIGLIDGVIAEFENFPEDPIVVEIERRQEELRLEVLANEIVEQFTKDKP